MKNKILFLFVILMLTINLVACQDSQKEQTKNANVKTQNVKEDSGIDAIKKKGKLIIGTSAAYPPYEFKTIKDGKQVIVGFDIEIAKKLAEKLGVELEIKNMDFKLLIEALKQGQIDMVVAGLSPTPERLKQILMSEVYYDAKQAVLIRAQDTNTLNSVESLKGKNLGAQMGSIQVDIAKKIENVKLKELPLTTALIADLKTKKIDAIVMEKPVAQQYAKSDEQLSCSDFVLKSDDSGSAIGINMANKDLLEFVNQNLKELKADGSIDKFVVEAIKLSDAQNSKDK